MDLEDFAAAAVGVPFQDQGRQLRGWDCWGLVIWGFRLVYGLELPDEDYDSRKAPEEAAVALLAGAQGHRKIPWGREQPGDVIMLRPCHAGIVLKNRRMLHCREEAGTVVERYDNGLWRHKLLGIYRHAQLSGPDCPTD